MNKLHKHDSLIFDLDGTLWDASQASAIGLTNGFKSLGINRVVEAKELVQVCGKPNSECIRHLLPDSPIPYNEMEDILNLEEREIVKKSGGILYSNVNTVLKELSGSYKLFLISNCQDWYLNLFFDLTDLRKLFVDSDCHGKSGIYKAEMIETMVSSYQLKCPVYIGDTDGDFQAASKAKIDFAFASYGFGNVTGGSYILRSFEDLRLFLEN